MGKKKGVARKLVLNCKVNEDDTLELTGPDDDGDVQVDIDVENCEPLGITLDRAGQEKAFRFFASALGISKAVFKGIEVPADEDSD